MTDLEVSFPAPCGEAWSEMAPAGCNRHCASCDKIIHDLEAYRFDEVKALVASDAEICVRARIGTDGAVRLKPGGHMVGRLVMAASAGMLAVASPAYAQPKGKIVGQVDNGWIRPIVTAKNVDGQTYRAAVRSDGRFWIKGLPAGNYVVSAQGCNVQWIVGNVTVSGGTAVLPPASDPTADDCIIIGVMSRKGYGG